MVAQKSWLCNELVCEFCRAIPALTTSDQILLTSSNIYAYLAQEFRKKQVYRDAIAFIKAKSSNGERLIIYISMNAPNNGDDSSVVIRQEQSSQSFKLLTNHLWIDMSSSEVDGGFSGCVILDDKFGNDQTHYFLRLIAPLIRPTRLFLGWNKPIAEMAHFLNVQSSSIDCVELGLTQFEWAPVYEALAKYNKLQFYGCGPKRCSDVSKLIGSPQTTMASRNSASFQIQIIQMMHKLH